MLLNVQDVAESCTCSTTSVLYGHIGTIYKFTNNYQGVPDYSGQFTIQVHAIAHPLWGHDDKCVDYAGVLIFKYPA